MSKSQRIFVAGHRDMVRRAVAVAGDLTQAQHAAYAWWLPTEATASDEVHPYTRQYFQ